MEKTNIKVLLLIVIGAFLTVGIGFSLAYYTAVISSNGSKDTIVKTANISMTLNMGELVTTSDKWEPGDYMTKSFSVTNAGSIDTYYTISMTDLLNTFANQNDLVYTITSIDGGYSTDNELVVSAKTTKIIDSYKIEPGVTQNYTLTITFKETNIVQNENQGAKFACRLAINEESKVYSDGVIASTPELYDGLIPVVYNSIGEVVVADINSRWYDYADHEWANAVLVDNTVKAYNSYSAGDIIPMSEILQMYVWIPRYRYQLWNANNESSSPQAINIVFENSSTAKSTGTTNGEWLTHPAFTFGTTELNGIWVGKFENSSGRKDFTNDTTNIQIKPNVYSMTNINVSTMFNAIRNVELQYSSRYGINGSFVDTHMLKNMEWGAVAYLTNSVYGRYDNTYTCIDSGCEVWINNVNTGYGNDTKLDTDTYQFGPTVTGCAGESVSAGVKSHMTACESGRTWYEAGVNASTTGNIYGLYDMSGGAWEYVMGNMVNSSGNFYSSSAGFSVTPDLKYYDSYAYSESTYTDYARGKLGDATRETLANFGSSTGGWYSDYTNLPGGTYSWFARGAHYTHGSSAGVLAFNRGYGGAWTGHSFRSVLVAE